MTIRLADRRARASEILIELGAVHFFEDQQPFIFTSGWASPVYIDIRKLVSAPRLRREIIQLAAEHMDREIGRPHFDVVAGGETAGIPLAAWLAEYFFVPMIYVRKEPKGFGRLHQIEGELKPGQQTILVEDLTTDGKSKINFCQALKRAGAVIEHTIVVFFYGVYPDTEKNLQEAGVMLHSLTDWRTTLEVAERASYFSKDQAKVVRDFLDAPAAWSKAHGGV